MLIVHSANRQLTQTIAQHLKASYVVHQNASYIDNTHAIDLAELRHQYQVDINLYPPDFAIEHTKLVVCDMDSTVITIECIDEMAKHAGVDKQVTAITKKAMQGELDFKQSLRQRLRMLTGLKVHRMHDIYHQNILSNGIRQLMDFCHQNHIITALVSGGFTFFAKRVVDTLNMTHCLANELEIIAGKLTGHVVGEIVDGKAKADFVQALCAQYNIAVSQVIAIGDGSNDIDMMDIAGLGIAYRAKDLVKQHADFIIDHGSLAIVIDLWDGHQHIA